MPPFLTCPELSSVLVEDVGFTVGTTMQSTFTLEFTPTASFFEMIVAFSNPVTLLVAPVSSVAVVIL